MRLSDIEARFVCPGVRQARRRRPPSVRLRGSSGWIRPGFTNISARSPTAISDPEIERITMFKAARVAPPLIAGRRAINNLLTGQGRYRIVERSKGRYRET
jgi:hypothetical protein